MTPMGMALIAPAVAAPKALARSCGTTLPWMKVATMGLMGPEATPLTAIARRPTAVVSHARRRRVGAPATGIVR